MNDKSSEGSIVVFLFCFYSESDLVEAVANSDTIASVTVLSGFHDPYIFEITVFFITLELVVYLLECFVLLILNSFGDVESKGNDFKDIVFL